MERASVARMAPGKAPDRMPSHTAFKNSPGETRSRSPSRAAPSVLRYQMTTRTAGNSRGFKLDGRKAIVISGTGMQRPCRKAVLQTDDNPIEQEADGREDDIELERFPSPHHQIANAGRR